MKNLRLIRLTVYLYFSAIFLLIIAAIIDVILGFPVGFPIYIFYFLECMLLIYNAISAFNEERFFRYRGGFGNYYPNLSDFTIGAFNILMYISSQFLFDIYKGMFLGIIISHCWLFSGVLILICGLNYSIFLIKEKFFFKL